MQHPIAVVDHNSRLANSFHIWMHTLHSTMNNFNYLNIDGVEKRKSQPNCTVQANSSSFHASEPTDRQSISYLSEDQVINCLLFDCYMQCDERKGGLMVMEM